MNKSTKRKPATSAGKESMTISFKALRENTQLRIVAGIALGIVSIYILCAMIGFFFSGGVDQSLVDGPMGKIITNPQVTANNPTGKLGAWISDLLINRWFGLPSFILCYLLMLCSFWVLGIQVKRLGRRLFIGILMVLWGSLLLGFATESAAKLLDAGTGYLFPGGGHGYFLSIWLNALVGRVGTILILVFTFVIILFFGFERTFYRCVKYVKEYLRRRKEKRIQAMQTQLAAEEEAAMREAWNSGQEEGWEELPEEGHPAPQEEQPRTETETLEELPFPEIPQPTEDTGEEMPEEEETDWNAPTEEESRELELTPLPSREEEDEEDEDPTLDVHHQQEEEKVKQNIVPAEDYDPTLELSHYEYPPLDLLEEHAAGNPKVTQEELEENKDKIVETLRNYKIEITKIKATIGPTVTLYEIVPAPGVKISKIKNLEDDIALSLAALGIRIIAPIPGAGTIGIEVPNQNPEVVSMHSIIASKKFQESKFALPVALGRTISNETYTFDLAKMPHLLVAGATGQGKSVGLNAIITSLLYKKHPSQLKFVMVDPKKVELSIYSVIEKHFLAKLPDEEEAIITDTTKVVNTLNSLCIEMDTRYDLLRDAQVRNIKEYNEKFIKRQLNPNNGHRYLPYIVVVVDEFADLIMTAGKEVETPIARIAQLARAVGIHMIIATQRPSTNVITGIIKANFPARIAFKVASMIDSRTILDSPGANQLIGRGDMLISVNSEMTRVQCAFVDTPEVDAITNFIAKQQSYATAFALPEYVPEGEAGGGFNEADLGQRDGLFADAARLIVSSQQGSTSAIQRRFSIGYNRAGRIMDQLEAAGIVGPYEGSKARQVLITDEYSLERMLNES